MSDINGPTARFITADAHLVAARRAVHQAQRNLARIEDQHAKAWRALTPDEQHEANLILLDVLEENPA